MSNVSTIPSYQTVILRQPFRRIAWCSMLLLHRRGKWWNTENTVDRIPTKWKLLIAGLIGSGTGLLILTMWRPGLEEGKQYPSNQISPPASRVGKFTPISRITSYDDGKSPIYCTIHACSTISCSLIPESLDPGQVASAFIRFSFEPQCPSRNTIEELLFEDCTFPNNTLQRNWLNTSLPITALTFHTCALADISTGAFATSVFTNLKTMQITTAKIRTLKKWTFQELSNLKNLYISDNIIHLAEYDLLQPIADSLEVLVLDGCLKDIDVLLNITKGNTLSKVKIMSIQRNSIKTITSQMFQSIPNVVSLYLGTSEIERCDVDSFTMTRSLELLDIKNNLLKNLPDGIFTTLLNKPDFRVSMMNNPWDCTCEFQWIQDMIKDHPRALTEIPTCESPDMNARLYFTTAKFCDYSTNTTTIGISPETTAKIPETGTTDNNPVDHDDDSKFLRFNCRNLGSFEASRMFKRKLFSTEEWKFPSRFQGFFAKPMKDGTVLVNFEVRSSGVSLIWFKTSDNEDLSGSSVSCVRNINVPFFLTNLERGFSYTICLLEELNVAPSPFNCLAIRTDPLTWTDTWLTNKDKAAVFSISITLIIIITVISVLSSFLVIRKNPSLLKGSKRVVMVRKRSIEALVLPQGIRMPRLEFKADSVSNECRDEPCGRKIPEPDYLVPLEVRESVENSSPRGPGRKYSKISRVSSQWSGGTYVSGIEPAAIELADWRRNEKFNNCSICLEDDELEEPPPLPPHRQHHEVIRSLSLAVDTNQNNDLPNHGFSIRVMDHGTKIHKLPDRLLE